MTTLTNLTQREQEIWLDIAKTYSVAKADEIVTAFRDRKIKPADSEAPAPAPASKYTVIQDLDLKPKPVAIPREYEPKPKSAVITKTVVEDYIEESELDWVFNDSLNRYELFDDETEDTLQKILTFSVDGSLKAWTPQSRWQQITTRSDLQAFVNE